MLKTKKRFAVWLYSSKVLKQLYKTILAIIAVTASVVYIRALVLGFGERYAGVIETLHLLPILAVYFGYITVAIFKYKMGNDKYGLRALNATGLVTAFFLAIILVYEKTSEEISSLVPILLIAAVVVYFLNLLQKALDKYIQTNIILNPMDLARRELYNEFRKTQTTKANVSDLTKLLIRPEVQEFFYVSGFYDMRYVSDGNEFAQQSAKISFDVFGNRNGTHVFTQPMEFSSTNSKESFHKELTCIHSPACFNSNEQELKTPEQPVETPLNMQNEKITKQDETIVPVKETNTEPTVVATESIETVGDAVFIPPVPHKNTKKHKKSKKRRKRRK